MSLYLESVYKFSLFVIPAKAGIQNVLKTLDSRFHGNDKKGDYSIYGQTLINGYKLGANSYIRKPVYFIQFSEAVRQLGIYWFLMNEPPPSINRREAIGKKEES